MMRTLIAIAALVVSVSALAQSQVPNVFEDGTPASAAEVNENFQYVLQAAGSSLVWASTDFEASGTVVQSAGMIEINSVVIEAPAKGVLVVSGSAFVNHYDPEPNYYGLALKLNGNSVIPPIPDIAPVPTVATTGVPVSTIAPDVDEFHLSYTITVPVEAGIHNVSQEVGPDSPVSRFFYNRNHLTVQYYQQSNASIIQAPPAGRSSETAVTSLGTPVEQTD